MNTRSFFVSVSVASCIAATAAAQDPSETRLRELLQERDAAIIELQQTVRRLSDRLVALERTVAPPTTAPAEASLAQAPAPAPAPSAGMLEIDEQAAQRALERTLIQGGALLLPAGRAELDTAFGYTHDKQEFPVLLSGADTFAVGSVSRERDAGFADLGVRIGLPWDAQLELGLPYLWIDEESSIRAPDGNGPAAVGASGRGFGSLRVGLAKTLLREQGWRPDVVGRVRWDTGSGRRDAGGVYLGGDLEAVSGSLSFIKRADPLVFLGSVSYRNFVDGGGDVEPGDQYGLSFGTALAVTPATSLSAVFSNQFREETEVGDVRIDGSDVTSISLSVGASTVVSRGILVNLSTSFGLSDDAPDYAIVLSTSIQSNALRR